MSQQPYPGPPDHPGAPRPGGSPPPVRQAGCSRRRLVVFPGGAAKGADAVYQDARDIRDGGGNGSIIGRNTFQRPRAEALAMLDKIVSIYQGLE